MIILDTMYKGPMLALRNADTDKRSYSVYELKNGRGAEQIGRVLAVRITADSSRTAIMLYEDIRDEMALDHNNTIH